MPARAQAGVARRRAWRPRAVVSLAAGLAIVAALVAYAGPSRVAAALANADAGLVAAAALAYATFFVLRGFRWSLLLGPGATGPATAAAITASGWLVSTLAPLKAGDVLRAAWMARRHGTSFGAVAGTVAIERTFDVLGLALVSSAGLMAVRLAGLPVPRFLGDVVAIAWLLPLAAAALLLALAWSIPAPTGDHLPARLMRVVRQALAQLPALARKPRALGLALGLTLLSIVAQCVLYALLVLAVVAPGAAASGGLAESSRGLAALAGAPLFLLSFALALTPGHLGTYEAAFVLVYATVGLAGPEALLPAALAVHLLTTSIVAVLGGLAFAAVGGTGRERSPAAPAQASADRAAQPEARP